MQNKGVVAFGFGQIGGEFFGGDTPDHLDSLLVLALATGKLDKFAGHATYQTDVVESFYENSDSDDLSVTELAALVRMDAQSVRNAIQKDPILADAVYLKDVDGSTDENGRYGMVRAIGDWKSVTVEAFEGQGA